MRELVAGGHRVFGLTRSPDKSPYLDLLGAEPVAGDLRDAGALLERMGACDAIVHAAAENSPQRQDVDRQALDGMLAAARAASQDDEGEERTVVYTSGCFVLGETGDRPAGEDAPTDDAPDYVAWRPRHEYIALQAASAGLATAVVRPGMVYGGRNGVFGGFFATAEQTGAAEFVGDGTNHWSPVHVEDVARLYRLIVERRGRGIFHATEDRWHRVGELARAASAATPAGGATRAVPLDEARKELGGFADALVMDQRIVSPRARAFGWSPQHPSFLDSAPSVYREWKG